MTPFTDEIMLLNELFLFRRWQRLRNVLVFQVLVFWHTFGLVGFLHNFSAWFTVIFFSFFVTELINDVSFLLSLDFVQILNVLVLLFWRFKGITYLKLALFLTIKVIPDNCVKFVLVVRLLRTLIVNFSWFNLECAFIFCYRTNHSRLFNLLVFNNR